MTVAELIEALESMPPEAEVKVQTIGTIIGIENKPKKWETVYLQTD